MRFLVEARKQATLNHWLSKIRAGRTGLTVAREMFIPAGLLKLSHKLVYDHRHYIVFD